MHTEENDIRRQSTDATCLLWLDQELREDYFDEIAYVTLLREETIQGLMTF